ncbi:hypothetical protein [Magnetovibrio sp.]|uniref:hypothetical protein n=1 Tax=Magnetovibrio sp. TaxID=2024836 RepID=UPI002F9412D5
MKANLIIAGLAFDLVGAFLLSVKVVWSDVTGRKIADYLEKQILRDWFEPVRGFDSLIHLIMDTIIWIPVKVVSLLLGFLRWSNENNYENQCGIIGLLFLSVGFIIQAIVNFQ